MLNYEPSGKSFSAFFLDHHLFSNYQAIFKYVPVNEVIANV